MTKVLAIALDSAEWRALEPLVDAGLMPNLAALRERSAFVRLDNSRELRTEFLWTEFATGRPGEEDGMWGMANFEPGEYDGRFKGRPNLKPWWAFGTSFSSVTIDLPDGGVITDEGVSGPQVVGWGAHAAGFNRTSLPEGLLAEIDARFGPHPAFGRESDPLWYSPTYIKNATDALVAGAAQRSAIFKYLLDQTPNWDFALSVWSEAHSGGHYMWHGADPSHPAFTTPTAQLAGEQMKRVHIVLDEAIGRAIADAGECDVCVFSLHGMKPNASDIQTSVLLPELLHRLHFKKPALRMPGGESWRVSGMPVVVPSEDMQWIDYVARHFADSHSRRAINTIKRAMPRPLLELARSATGRANHRPGVLFGEIPPEQSFSTAKGGIGKSEPTYMPLWWYRHRWPSMRYFAVPSFTDGLVRINLRGRERDGLVDVDDYRRACDEVIAEVRSATSPLTGKSIVADVEMMRANDPFDPDGPPADIAFRWSDSTQALDHPTAGLIGPVPYQRAGEHDGTGFAFFAGEGIAAGDLGERPGLDLPATLLAMLGREAAYPLAGVSMLERH